ncbi:MAG: SPASM domain-containing protein, partial [Candidatus Krumholzibacteria bacterium]|nr:SPASM domain-containing protein [Candidatus Krumholzibacteria bacterium]
VYSEGKVPRGGWGNLDPTLCEKILLQIKKNPPALGVSLHLAGEPMLHPEIDRLVKLVHEHLGTLPTMASNGTVMTEEKSDSIARAGGASIVICFSSDPKVFERMRTGGDWEMTRKNISYALDAGLHISLHAYDEDIEGMRKLFGEDPNLVITRFQMHNFCGDFSNVVERRFNLTVDRSRYHPCSHLWFGMAVAWNGEVVICCRDSLHEHPTGNLNSQTVEEVWRGDEFIRLRYLHARRDLDELELCKTCDRPFDPANRPGMILKKYSRYLKF